MGPGPSLMAVLFSGAARLPRVCAALPNWQIARGGAASAPLLCGKQSRRAASIWRGPFQRSARNRLRLESRRALQPTRGPQGEATCRRSLGSRGRATTGCCGLSTAARRRIRRHRHSGPRVPRKPTSRVCNSSRRDAMPANN